MQGQLPSLKPYDWPETPSYVYSQAVLACLADAFERAVAGAALPIRLHYAAKANSNPDLLAYLNSRGFGADIVSGGELELARRAGIPARSIVFSGVGKTRAELAQAAEADLAEVNVESRGELHRLIEAAQRAGRRPRVSFRVNPDVDARTHPYISTGLSEHKFGIPMNEAVALFEEAARSPHVELVGVSVHIGSQLLELSALREALLKTIAFAAGLKSRGVRLRVLDVGGGLGVDYQHPRRMPPFEAYGAILREVAERWKEIAGPDGHLVSECGRALVSQAGWLVTRVIGVKQTGAKHFAIVDASMTELMRPALYKAWHPIETLSEGEGNTPFDRREERRYEIVGPVCESSDVLASDRVLPELFEGDALAIGCAGAYGYVMASTYNARALPAEYWWPEGAESPEISRSRRVII